MNFLEEINAMQKKKLSLRERMRELQVKVGEIEVDANS